MDVEETQVVVNKNKEVIEIIDIEEGELNEHDEQNKNNAKFEITFEDNDEYEKLADTITNILKENLTALSGRKFKFLKSPCKIKAFEQIEERTTEETQIKIDNEILEIDSDGNESVDFGDSLNKLFMIDATPSDKLESGRVPSYKRVRMRKTVLDDEVQTKKPKNDEEACPRPKPISACFNCGAYEHGIRDCPEPRNSQRIARAKRTHSSKGERYHVDVDQRFAHLRPGVISDKLKKALGLRSKELPSFYHRMRIFGYPPGWLEDAKVSHSGLAMFNSGDDVLKEENSSDSESAIKYDISKIIEFPGFNVMPHDYRDDYKFYNVPPYGRQYSKESMITALGDNAIKGFKRKKIKDHTEAPSTYTKSDTMFNIDIRGNDVDNDMEIEDGEVAAIENVEFIRPMPPPPPEEDVNLPPPLPIEPEPQTGKTPTPSSPPETSESECTVNERAKSPTLEELEAQQRDLLLKLTNGGDALSEELKLAIISPATETTATPATPETPSTPLTPLSSDSDLKSVVKFSHMGTPVLKFSPYEKVPSGDNFKVGVSDVINFENLPDSTGKYEAMKVVIGKVRSMKKILDAEDD